MLEKNKVQKLVFFGAGDLAKLAWLALQGTSLEIVAVIDNNKIGENFNGVTIREMNYLGNLDFDRVVVTCDGTQDAFQSAMLDAAIPESKIVQLA